MKAHERNSKNSNGTDRPREDLQTLLRLKMLPDQGGLEVKLWNFNRR